MSAPRRPGSLALFLIVFGALVLRILFALDYARSSPLAERPVIDEAAYERWALEIADGDWIGVEVFFQEPLYAYWLGAVYSVAGYGADAETVAHRQRTAARHSQALLGALTVLLVMLVSERLFGGVAALVAGIAAATYRPLAYFPSLLLKPNLFLPVLALLVWMLLGARVARAGRGLGRGLGVWFGAGLVAALGALLRGNLLILLPGIAALPLVRAWRGGAGLGAGLAPAAAFVGGVLLVLLPIAVRNQAVGGVFALTTSGAGTNVYGGNNADNPYGRATEFDWVRGVPEHEAGDWQNEAQRRTGRMLDAGEVSSFWFGQALSSMRADPWLHARILWNKLRLTLGAYEVPDNHHIEWDAQHVAALRLPLPGFGLWGMLGLAGALTFVLRRRLDGAAVDDARGAWEVLALAFLYAATIVLTVTSMRVRLGLVPLLLPFAGYWVHAVLARAPARSWALPLLIAAAIVHWPVFGADEVEADLVKRDYNYAVHLMGQGALDEAAVVVAAIAQRHPRSVQRALLEAELGTLRALSAPEEGRGELFTGALKRLRVVAEGESVAARDRYRAQRLAGFVYYEMGNWPIAELRFREALSFDPGDARVRFNLAVVLFLRAADLGGRERMAALVEARSILAELQAETPSAVLEERLREVEARLRAR